MKRLEEGGGGSLDARMRSGLGCKDRFAGCCLVVFLSMAVLVKVLGPVKMVCHVRGQWA